MTALAMDVRELGWDEIGLVAGGEEELSSDAKLAISVATLVGGAIVSLVVPLHIQVFLLVVFTPGTAN